MRNLELTCFLMPLKDDSSMKFQKERYRTVLHSKMKGRSIWEILANGWRAFSLISNDIRQNLVTIIFLVLFLKSISDFLIYKESLFKIVIKVIKMKTFFFSLHSWKIAWALRSAVEYLPVQFEEVFTDLVICSSFALLQVFFHVVFSFYSVHVNFNRVFEFCSNCPRTDSASRRPLQL